MSFGKSCVRISPIPPAGSSPWNIARAPALPVTSPKEDLPMTRRMIAPALTALLLSAGAVAAQDAQPMGHEATGPDLSTLGGAFSASVQGPEGTDHGSITVQPTPSGVSVVTLALTDLPPGIVAVHLHQTGACDAPDYETAGGHLALDGEEHGVLSENGPHIGDMPNLHVPESGAVMVEHFIPGLSAEVLDDEDGTGFIIHAHADDYQGQPAGHAGPRLACGVLSAAE
ncbi:superoxide dismutase family protein [Paracoccus liaowanqingii]|uniref:Superoxide dismutase family protein n=1 Tax=Paracoccus liaowanqingii TaxID=2560053 RepID=A0A4Z1CQ18_9RHOB|nr:superoxide dismutase family protein [Paracoccus liaowanqingii]